MLPFPLFIKRLLEEEEANNSGERFVASYLVRCRLVPSLLALPSSIRVRRLGVADHAG